MLKIDRINWQVYLCRYRVHHGGAGLILTIVGLALMYHDRSDYPWRP